MRLEVTATQLTFHWLTDGTNGRVGIAKKHLLALTYRHTSTQSAQENLREQTHIAAHDGKYVRTEFYFYETFQV